MSDLPSCFGREWNLPGDPQTCGRCEVEDRCKPVFALTRMPEVAKQLGYEAVQAVPEQMFAEHCETSVEAIRLARAFRLDPKAVDTSAEPSLSEPPIVASEPQPGPAPSTETSEPLPLVADSEPRSEPKARKPRTTKKSAGLPAVSVEPEVTEPISPSPDPEPSRVGFLLNLTTGALEHAEWPGFPPLFLVPRTSMPILQVTFWSAALGKWAWLVAESPSGRTLPEGVVELSWEHLVDASMKSKVSGFSVEKILRAALGL